MRKLVQFIYLVIEFQETDLMYTMLSRLNNQYREINRRLGSIHRKVSRTGQITNNVFGIPMFMMFGIRFTLLIFDGHILSHIIFNTFYLARSTVTLVHQIWNSIESPETTILQLFNGRPKFTGSEFFKIDWPIIILITGAVTTYIAIIIQFEIAAAVSNNSTLAHFHHHHSY
ncbi:PREDICTED: uncharacterized protein LOC108567896 [Nicrophorus vespilloides]|uniref:Uncharacterized protein LOC108567896 n=1 Tax=Nicrophorus vespilloides TaxID=110193 RepID=A0ABM1NBA2_NICVS|nr:PREDICTED: uncharacterized protein LOC108567896 [Nicrophorus vespilloides]